MAERLTGKLANSQTEDQSNGRFVSKDCKTERLSDIKAFKPNLETAKPLVQM